MSTPRKGFSGRIDGTDLKTMRVFCTVVEKGGFAAAESELQVGLPSISRTISDLETRLGMALCKRGRAGFAVTEQGRRVHAAMQRLLADIGRFECELQTIHTELVGTLSIGMLDTLITDPAFCLPAGLRHYRRLYPGVRLSMSVGNATQIEQCLLDGALDAAVMCRRRPIDKLAYRTLYHESTNLYCDAEHPLAQSPSVAVADLLQHDYVGYPFPHGVPSLKTGGVLNKTATVDHVEGAATLIATGCFIGFLPDHYAQSLQRIAAFHPILPEIFGYESEIVLATGQGTPAPPVSALLAVIAGITDSAAIRD